MKKLLTSLLVLGAVAVQAQVADYKLSSLVYGTNAAVINGSYTLTPTTAAGSFSNAVVNLRLYRELAIQINFVLATNLLWHQATDGVSAMTNGPTPIVDNSNMVFTFICSMDNTNWDTNHVWTITKAANGTNPVTINTNIVVGTAKYFAPFQVFSGSSNSAVTFTGIYATKPNREQNYSNR